ncbi:Caprin homolog [Eumeta japonica]|uniref:Caprin homolog n=1 Tax=Eumeta variegata TaxID=151549 RepID=A0A4C1SVV8_EUMVA|nr:Caprin homolog [Eumeta japonica]
MSVASKDAGNDALNPMKLTFTTIEHKIRNLEKRKELIAKAQAETTKIREVLIIQNILSCFTDDAVRNDFSSEKMELLNWSQPKSKF